MNAELKERRQRALADIIRGDSLSSQDELAERLAALGFSVTQATISRDLEQIGAVKVRDGGQMRYALPDQARAPSVPPIDAMLRQWAIRIDRAMNMVVIKTPPGSAHLIGVALDQSDLPSIVGTICGDDTVFLACGSIEDAESLVLDFRSAIGFPAS